MNSSLGVVVSPHEVGAQDHASLIEALLFSTGRPMSVDQLAGAVGTDAATIERTLDMLRRRADERGILLSWDGRTASLIPNPKFAAVLRQANRTDVERSVALVEEYLSVQKQKGRRPKTLDSYRLFMVRFAREIGRPVDEVETRDVRQFLLSEEQRGNGISTIASKIHKLSSLYKWLEREELIGRNPMLRIDAPPSGKSNPKYLSHEETEQVRETAKGLDRVLFETLYSSGVRVSEAVALDWDDIDLNGKGLVVRDGKGGKDRMCPLSTRAVLLLRQYRDQRKDNEPWVFRSQFRKRMSKESIERRIRILGEKAGLKKRLTPHRMRHSLATHLLEAGMPIDMVQQILGHSSVKTTQTYARTQAHQIDQFYRRVFP